MLSACSYVYADKFTACVQNVCLPNARMLWVAHATDQWMRFHKLLKAMTPGNKQNISITVTSQWRQQQAEIINK